MHEKEKNIAEYLVGWDNLNILFKSIGKVGDFISSFWNTEAEMKESEKQSYIDDVNAFLKGEENKTKLSLHVVLYERFIDIFDIDSETIEIIKEAFHKRHEELYTYSELESSIELVNIESTVYGRIDRPSPTEIKNNTSLKDALKSNRNLIFSNLGELIKTPVYDGNLLSNGHKIHGPAVVEEDTTTLVIEPGWMLELHKSGTYIIKRKDY